MIKTEDVDWTLQAEMAKHIKMRMAELNMTRYALGKKAGLRGQHIKEVLECKKNVPVSTMYKIALALECSVETLCTGEYKPGAKLSRLAVGVAWEIDDMKPEFAEEKRAIMILLQATKRRTEQEQLHSADE